MIGGCPYFRKPPYRWFNIKPSIYMYTDNGGNYMINIDKLIVKNSKTEGFHEEDFAKWSRIASPSTQVTARHPTRRTRDPVQPETTPNRNRDQQQPGFHHAWMWQKFGLTSKNGTWEQYVAWHQPWYSSVAKVWMIWKGIYIYGKKETIVWWFGPQSSLGKSPTIRVRGTFH